MIKGKTPEEIRKTFNIKNDFTEEEEAQVRKENQWCEEKWSLVPDNWHCKDRSKYQLHCSVYNC